MIDQILLKDEFKEFIFKLDPSSNYISLYKTFRAQFDKNQQDFLDCLFDVYESALGSIASKKRTVIALIHGIRTNGEWQERARDLLSSEDTIKAMPLGYDYFDVFKFLSPFRNGPIERIKRELRDIQTQYDNCALTVIAHSFGTYITAKILMDSPDIKISKVLLCGSIIPTKFSWDKVTHNLTHRDIINEVGTKDFWPVVARISSYGYGCSGRFGFKTNRVSDRYFDYAHSDFFTEAHVSNYWKPFIENDEIIKSPWDSRRKPPGFFINLMAYAPYPKTIIFTIFFILYFFIYQ